MASLFRDAPAGQLIRFLTRNRVLRYPEERPDFKLPDTWAQLLNDDGLNTPEQDEISAVPTATPSSNPSDEESQVETASDDGSKEAANLDLGLRKTKTREDTTPNTQDRLEADQIHNLEKTTSTPIVPRKTKDGTILVDWYYTDDAENPQNWSSLRRAMITAVICIYTFVVYLSSAIYTTSELGIMERFGVNETQAALGLSLFVLG